jgi:hypothetical protein
MKNQEFEILEVKINKKVSNRSASIGNQVTTNPTTTDKKSSPLVNSIDSSINMGYSSLSKIEKHYFDQIKVMLKGSNERSLREAIGRFSSKDISTERLSEILSMVLSQSRIGK